jgi:hypothetical protein
MKKAKPKHTRGRRNAAPAAPRSAPRRHRLMPPIPDPPDWKTALASVVGGGGSALLGGWLAEKGWDQQMVGIAMTTGGVVGALALPGSWRVAANGVAASGAGQFALATVHKAAVNKVKEQLGSGEPPKRNALPPSVSDAFASTPFYGGGYGSSLDDEERMTDPDLFVHAA